MGQGSFCSSFISTLLCSAAHIWLFREFADREIFFELPLIYTERLTQLSFEFINTLSRCFNFMFTGLFPFVMLSN